MVAVTKMTHDAKTHQSAENDAPKGEPTRNTPLHQALPRTPYLPHAQCLSNSNTNALTDMRRVYFTVWMVTPSRDLAGARPVDLLKTNPSPLLRALEAFRWR